MKYLNHFKFFIHSGCNAATCDPQVGYCHLGYYKGLDNVSLTHQNLSKDEKPSFHLMEDSKCKGSYVIKYYIVYKDTSIYFSGFLKLSIYYITIQGCFLKDTGRNGGRNFGTFTNVISEYQCQRKCQENDECEYFVFKKSTLECKLTSKSASPIKRVGHLFGPKYC